MVGDKISRAPTRALTRLGRSRFHRPTGGPPSAWVAPQLAGRDMRSHRTTQLVAAFRIPREDLAVLGLEPELTCASVWAAQRAGEMPTLALLGGLVVFGAFVVGFVAAPRVTVALVIPLFALLPTLKLLVNPNLGPSRTSSRLRRSRPERRSSSRRTVHASACAATSGSGYSSRRSARCTCSTSAAAWSGASPGRTAFGSSASRCCCCW